MDFYEEDSNIIEAQENLNNADNGKVKSKKSNSIFKKGAKLVAGGIIFGLCAGLVFQGVNLAGNALFNTNQVVEDTSVNTIASNTALKNDNSTQTTLDVTNVASKVMPSIVSITSTTTQTVQTWFEQYEQEAKASGSGIIIGQNDSELLIVTNYHVVEGAKGISVGFADDALVDASIKGYDKDADLAVLTVKTKDMDKSTLKEIAVAAIGDSSKLQVGEPAIAIGNALGYGQSVTVGYISAVNRTVDLDDKTMTLLQTDAAINPGNSGGALLNMNGEVIGINTVKFVDSTIEGMGYAIPISDAMPIINELMNAEEIAEEDRGYLGIKGKDVSEEYAANFNMPEGVYVAIIGTGSPAELGGLNAGDIITKFDGKTISSMEELQNSLATKKSGDDIVISVQRKDIHGEYKEIELNITLGSRSE